MTTVTEGAQRERQIIVQTAVNCFLERGIPEVSMQDIAERSGLPASVVENHFASKIDVIRVLGGMNRTAASGVLREILKEPSLPSAVEIVTRVAVFFEKSIENGDPVAVAPQAWGVAFYDADVEAIMREVFADLRELWVEVARRLSAEGRLPEGSDPEDVGRTFFSIVLGFMLQSLLGDVKAGHVTRALHALFC